MDTHSQNDLQISLFTFYSEHIIQHSRFVRQDGWQLDDISLCSSGNIAVSGYNYLTDRSFVCVYSTVDNSDSRDKPTLFYDKEFEHKDSEWPPRRISFMEPNSTEIVTCRNDEVQVIDYNRDVVLRSRKVNGKTTCLSVSESQIFIGLWRSDIVNIYDKDLNRIKSIRLKEIRGYPGDMTAAADRLYVRTAGYDKRAIVYSQNSGSILTEYCTGNYAYSVTVNVQIAVVAVLWDDGWPKRQVAVYSFTDNNCLVVFDVESGVSRIRISDQGRIVTGNLINGEVKIYDLPQIFTNNNLKVTLSSLFSKYDLEELLKYFKISDDSLENVSDKRRDEKKKAARILTVLEEKGFFKDGDFHYLKEAFSHLGSCSTSKFMNLVDFYQQHADKNRSNETQASDSNESGYKLQLDGFSSDWTACDMSLSSAGMVVVSGHSRTTKKTSLDVMWKDNSGSWDSWVKTRKLEDESKSECFVSVIDEYRVVTCCGNVVEIINCNTNETDIRVSLQSSGCASCIAVRDQDVYISFKESSTILVLNRDLQEKGSVTLKEVKDMWPVDLAVTPGKLLVCLKNKTFSQVLLFKENDGQKLVEYKNIADKTQTPLSVAVSEESDLVGILWSSDAVVGMSQLSYDDKTCAHVSLHSLTHGYCLSLVAVVFAVHGFQHRFLRRYGKQSCGRRVRFLTGQVAVMDEPGGVKLFNMKEVLSEENVTATLSQMLSFKDHKELKSSLKDDSKDDGRSSEVDDSKGRRIQYHEKMRRLDDILGILTSKGHLKVESVNNLRRQFSHHEHRHLTGRFPGELKDNQAQVVGFGRGARCRHGSEHNVNISAFASSHTFAVSVSCPKRICSSFIYIYHWDVSSNTKPMLYYYRKFESGPFVSSLDKFESGPFVSSLDKFESGPFVSSLDKFESGPFVSSLDKFESGPFVSSLDKFESGPFVSYLDKFESGPFVSVLGDYKAIICHDGVIEIVALTSSHAKVTASQKLRLSPTCMATWEGDVYLGCRSSEIMVLNSNLVLMRIINMKGENFGCFADLAVTPGRLFVCTGGILAKALSVSEEDGQTMVEYNFLTDEEFRGSRVKASSITVSESNDAVGICWHSINYLAKVSTITLHSMSKGTCLAIVDDVPVAALKFCGEKTMLTLSSEGTLQSFHLDQRFMFQHWKTLLSYAIRISSNDCEKLCKFYEVSEQQLAEKRNEARGYFEKTIQVKCLLDILDERGVISPVDVSRMEGAKAILSELYTEKLWQPIQAYMKFSGSQSPGCKCSEVCISHHQMDPFYAEQVIDETGGKLDIPKSGISLEVPPDALKKAVKISLTVVYDPRMSLSIDEDLPVATPVVRCEPCGLHFSKSVTLNLPHCAVVDDDNTETTVVCYSGCYESEPTISWRRVSDSFASLFETNLTALIDHFSLFFFKIKRLKAKVVRVIPFTKEVGDKILLNLWVCNDFEPLFCRLCQSQEELNFQRQATFESFNIYKKFKDIEVELTKISHQTINLRRIWSGQQVKASFTIERNTENRSIDMKIKQTLNDEVATFHLEFHVGSFQGDYSIGTTQIQERKASADDMTALFQYLSKNFGPEWMFVGRKLKVKEGTLKQITVDYDKSIREASYQMLLHWKQEQGSKATYNALIKALEESERTDLAELI